MKASWWKYVLLALLAAGVVACGKDNKGANTANNVYSYTSGVQTPAGATSISDFRNKVAAGQFLVQPTPQVTYLYGKLMRNGSSNCSKWWIFTSCSYSGGSGSSNMTRSAATDGSYFRHELAGDGNALVNKLVWIASHTYMPIQSYNGSATTLYAFRTSEGDYYIDLAQPMVANPVQFIPADTEADGYYYTKYYYQYITW